jgi:TetR/AcrR family transcriptional repressor for divergent bdcA
VLEEAACRYAGKAGASGCVVIEGVQSIDEDAKRAAMVFLVGAEAAIRDFVARRATRRPVHASVWARNGHTPGY